MDNKVILRVNNLEKYFGNKVLFDKSNLLIHKGDKLAFLGQNGTGKTTFIKCIIEEEDYAGDIELDANVSIAIMEQEKIFEKIDLTFDDYLREKREELLKKKEKIEEQFANPEVYDDTVLYENLLHKYGRISQREESNVDENNLRDLLEEIGFEMKDYGKKICDLSGGQRTKLRLAEVLMKDADFFILDEPTNHLDFETIRWLEKNLFYSKNSFIVISHDRHFLHMVSNKVVEIENKNFQVYKCDFSDFLKKKKKHLEVLKNKHHSVTKEKDRLKKSEKEKREWAHKNGSKKLKVQADRLKREYDRFGDIDNPDDFSVKFDLEFREGTPCSSLVARGKSISKSFGEHEILDNISFEVLNGDKIAILGKNGCGKSTLLNIIAQDVNVDSGIIKFGTDLKIGFLEQEFKKMNLKKTVMNYVWEADQKLMEHHIISSLIKFGFAKEKINNKLSTLSGGEKTRINLVKLMLSRCNVLLLDEPTNHLDIELIESLEKAINKFKGAVVFVSHDRRFIENVAKKQFMIKNKKLEVIENSI